MNRSDSLDTLEAVWAYVDLPDASEQIARQAFEALIQQNLDAVEPWLAYAEYLVSTGAHGRALKCLLSALNQGVACFELYFFLGVCYKALDRVHEALGAWQHAVDLDPDNAVCLNNLGWTLSQEGQPSKGLPMLEKAVSLSPAYLTARHNLIETLRRMGQLDAAIENQLSLVRLEEVPGHYVKLANLFMEKGQLEKARQILLTVQQTYANDATVQNALGGVYYKFGDLEQARGFFKRASELAPGFVSAVGNYLLCLNYSELPASEIFQAHLDFGRALGQADSSAPSQLAASDGVLRVGFVSPDFYQHPVGQLFEPVLLALADSQQVLVTLYHVSNESDDITLRLKGKYGERFQASASLSDDLLLKKIRADRQDVLLDLTGHTSGHRLPVFARRAAPIQASYLGYPNTTGVPAMDFRIVDEFTDPEPTGDALASECLMRIPAPFLNLTAPRLDLEVNALPSLNSAGFVFGCFNNIAKLSDSTIQTWAAVMWGLPSARLLLKAASFADEEIKRYQLERFARLGLPIDRVDLRARMGFSEHLALYGQIDLCLDPFPYNGTATSIESLWMGVPFVTLQGDSHVSRVGTSLCRSLGLDDFVATDKVSYVQRCLWWASQKQALDEIRRSMRKRIIDCGVADAQHSARKLEGVLLEMVARKRSVH